MWGGWAASLLPPDVHGWGPSGVLLHCPVAGTGKAAQTGWAARGWGGWGAVLTAEPSPVMDLLAESSQASFPDYLCWQVGPQDEVPPESQL